MRQDIFKNIDRSSSDNENNPEHFKGLHVKARTEKPSNYPERFPVPDDKVDWAIDYPEYKPDYFVAPVVIDNDETVKAGGWADPEDITKVKHDFTSYQGPVKFDPQGRPLNPCGRTGIAGRGLLGKHGANFAADPIITSFNETSGQILMLAIQRKDNGQWAIPGGMVDAGEAVTKTLQREFKEETGVELDMDDAEPVYRGYVDDPRNTDHAWMETEARHKHLPSELAQAMRPKAGDDAKGVRWLELTPDTLSQLYASHAELVIAAITKYLKREGDHLTSGKKEMISQLLSGR